MAMQTLRHREDALDLSQDVFLKLWRSLPSFRGECSVATFVMKIAKNTILDRLRQKASGQTLSLSHDNDDGESEEYDLPDPDIDSNPAAAYERQEKIKAVTALYDAIGIKELCQQKIESYFLAAEESLTSINIEESRKSILREFALSLMKRNV